MRANQWREGFKAGIPICLGYFAISFTFGVQAGGIGLSTWQTFLISLTNVTSAGQFAEIDLIAYGAGYAELALTQLILNIRYCLMSCALSQKLDENSKPWHRFFIAYGVTDEIFGVTVCTGGKFNPFYSYGVMSSAIPGWLFGTLCGSFFGNVMPQNVLSAFGVAIYGMFLAIILPPAKKDRVVLTVVCSAMLGSFALSVLPYVRLISSGFRIILVTIVIAGLAAVLHPIEERESIFTEENE